MKLKRKPRRSPKISARRGEKKLLALLIRAARLTGKDEFAKAQEILRKSRAIFSNLDSRGELPAPETGDLLSHIKNLSLDMRLHDITGESVPDFASRLASSMESVARYLKRGDSGELIRARKTALAAASELKGIVLSLKLENSGFIRNLKYSSMCERLQNCFMSVEAMATQILRKQGKPPAAEE